MLFRSKAEETRKAEEERKQAEEKRKADEAAALAAEEAAARAAEEEARAFELIKNQFTQSTPVLNSPAQGKVYTEDDFDALIPKIDFNWQKIDGAKSYEFVIKDSSGKTLVSKTVNTNKFTLSSNDLSLVSENGEYTWSVKAVQTIDKQIGRAHV